MLRPKLELTIGSLIVSTWTRASLTRELGSLAVRGQFTALDLAPRGPLPFETGETATVRVDGHKVLTGFVRVTESPIQADQGRLSFTVASTSTDLDECSVDRGSFRKATPRVIASALVADYGLRVLGTEPKLDLPLPKFVVRPGETVAVALERLAKRLSLMVTSDTGNGVVFARAGGLVPTPIRTRLQLPGNVIGGNLRLSDTQQFSPIIVRGQSRGADNAFGDQIAGAHAEVTDPNIKRHRPLVVTAPGRGVDLQAYAEWERARRYGEAQSLMHSVLGFSHADGPWEPNQVVTVLDQSSRVTGPLLVAGLTYTLTEQQARTMLTLTRLEAYLPEPPPKKRKGRGL